MSIVVNGFFFFFFFLIKIINRLANSEDPDEMAHYELSHLDLHCLHTYLYQSTGLKWLRQIFAFNYNNSENRDNC